MNISSTNRKDIPQKAVAKEASAQQQMTAPPQEDPKDEYSPMQVGLMGAAAGGVIVGAPAALGATMHSLSGPLKTAVGFYAPVAAAVGFGTLAGYKAYKGSNGHPVMVGAAALGAAAVTGIGTQVGIVPGLAFGWPGAALAAVGGAVVLGAGVAYMEMNNPTKG